MIKLDANNKIVKLFNMFREFNDTFHNDQNEDFYKAILTQIVYFVSLEAEKTHIAPTKQVAETTRKAILFINKNFLKP